MSNKNISSKKYILIFCLVIMSTLTLGMNKPKENVEGKIFKNIYIQNIDVGSMTTKQAKDKIYSIYNIKPINIKYGEKIWSIDPEPIKLKYDIDEYSILGLISSTVNNVPMMGIYNKMNWKGKIMNAAFSVSGAFVFGGQLGYVSTVSSGRVNAFIVGKLVGGISALVLAIILINKESKREILEI